MTASAIEALDLLADDARETSGTARGVQLGASHLDGSIADHLDGDLRTGRVLVQVELDDGAMLAAGDDEPLAGVALQHESHATVVGRWGAR